MHPTWGLVIVERGSFRGKCFEGLPRGVRGDALACRWHPYMFFAALNKERLLKTNWKSNLK
jgi:hypothetical protein